MEGTQGPLILDLEGCSLTSEEQELLSHPLVGGVILFSRNYENRKQLTTLCEQIRAQSGKPMVIMVDQEGGRVQRFKESFTRLPAVANFGKMYDISPATALQAAKSCGWLMATELLATGVDLSLAPILDLDKNINEAIGDRAFHADPQIAAAIAEAYIAGMREAGMAAVGKHFPGHGSVAADSHEATPVDNRNYDEIVHDMLPFKRAFESDLPAVMTAHIIFPQVDSAIVTYSPKWLTTILRQQLRFQGTIVSDDLNMKGASDIESYADRFSAARTAGCDVILFCNNRPAIVEILDQIDYLKHPVANAKWQQLRGNPDKQRGLLDTTRLHKTRIFLDTAQSLSRT